MDALALLTSPVTICQASCKRTRKDRSWMLWLTFPFVTTCQASFKLIRTSQILIHNT